MRGRDAPRARGRDGARLQGHRVGQALHRLRHGLVPRQVVPRALRALDPGQGRRRREADHAATALPSAQPRDARGPRGRRSETNPTLDLTPRRPGAPTALSWADRAESEDAAPLRAGTLRALAN